MNLPTPSFKRIKIMVDKKLDNSEISALLEAFGEISEQRVKVTQQSNTFKSLILFCNVYALTFMVLYYFLREGLIDALDARLIADDFKSLFNGRAHVMFWLIIFVNISAYFNIGFKLLCLIVIIFLLNNTIDNIVLFSGLIDVNGRPFLSIFILSRPIFFAAVVWMALVFRDNIQDN